MPNCGILIGDDWYIYADYWINDQTRVWQANDFTRITPVDAMSFPRHLRHGTIFRAPRSDVEALLHP